MNDEHTSQRFAEALVVHISSQGQRQPGGKQVLVPSLAGSAGKGIKSSDKGAQIMTPKDYILIAEALREVHGVASDSTTDVINAWRNGVETSAEAIADALAVENPRFNRNHFLAVVRGERELTSRPPRKLALEDWAQNLADQINAQAGECQ